MKIASKISGQPLVLAVGWGVFLGAILGCAVAVAWTKSDGESKSFPALWLAVIGLCGALGGHTCHLWRLAVGLRSGINLATWLHQSMLNPLIAGMAGLGGVGIVYVLARLLFDGCMGANLPALSTFASVCGGLGVAAEWRRRP